MSQVKEVYEALQSLAIKESITVYNKNRKDFLSSSDLKIAAQKSLADYYAKINSPDEGDTPAKLEGRANHTLTLEGDQRFLAEYAIGGPVNPKTGQEYGVGTKAFLTVKDQAAAQGKDLITHDINNRCGKIRNSCREHTIISHALSSGVAEMVFRVKLHGVDCQIRIDWLSPVYGIIDMKTCEELDRFKRDAEWKWGYHYSAAFYRSVLKALVPDLPALPYSFLAVEKTGIYKAGLFNMDDDVLDRHEKMNTETIKKIAECRQTNVWPTGYEEIQYITERI